MSTKFIKETINPTPFPQCGWGVIYGSFPRRTTFYFFQLFIFYTISEFGAVVFVIISTLRQMMAIVISTLLYGHTITAIGILGILLVFGAIYLKVFCGLRTKRLKKNNSSAECNSEKE